MKYRHSRSIPEIRRSLIRLLTEAEKAKLMARSSPFTVESIADFIHEDALRVLRGANTPTLAQIRQANTPTLQTPHPTLDAIPDSFWESLRGLPADEQLRRMKAIGQQAPATGAADNQTDGSTPRFDLSADVDGGESATGLGVARRGLESNRGKQP